jgi:hypothetical protein
MSEKPNLCAPLADTARAICRGCRRIVWEYPTPAGEWVAVDAAPGPYVVDGLGKLWQLGGFDGYRGHECAASRTLLTPEVTDAEFLWALV